MPNLYDLLKDFYFSMPGGWTAKKIGIFVESCRFHHKDLERTVDDITRWRRIALFGAKISEDENLFNVNNCIELAQCLRSYAESNFVRLGHDSNFHQYLRDIQDLVDYFPKVENLDEMHPSSQQRARHFEDGLLEYINSKSSFLNESSIRKPSQIATNTIKNHDSLLRALRSTRERVIQRVKNPDSLVSDLSSKNELITETARSHDSFLSELKAKRERVIEKTKRNENSQHQKDNSLYNEIDQLILRRNSLLGLTNPPVTGKLNTIGENMDTPKDFINKELAEGLSHVKLNIRQLQQSSSILLGLSSRNGREKLQDNTSFPAQNKNGEQFNHEIHFASSSNNNRNIENNCYDIIKDTKSESGNGTSNVCTINNELKGKLNNQRNPHDVYQEDLEVGFQELAPFKSEIGSVNFQSKNNSVVKAIIDKMISEVAADFSTSESIEEAVNFLKEGPELQKLPVVNEKTKKTELTVTNSVELKLEEVDHPEPIKDCYKNETIVENSSGKNDSSLKTIKLESTVEEHQANKLSHLNKANNQYCLNSACSKIIEPNLDGNGIPSVKTLNIIKETFDLESSQKADHEIRPFKKRGRPLKQKVSEVITFSAPRKNTGSIVPPGAEVSLGMHHGTVISPADTSSMLDGASSSFRSPSDSEETIFPSDVAFVSSTMENSISDENAALKNLVAAADVKTIEERTSEIVVLPASNTSPAKNMEVNYGSLMNMIPVTEVASSVGIHSKLDEAKCDDDTVQVHTTSELEDERIIDVVINCGNVTNKNNQIPVKQKRGRSFKNVKELKGNEFHLSLSKTLPSTEEKNRPFKKREMSRFKEIGNPENKQNDFIQLPETRSPVIEEPRELRKRKLNSEVGSTEIVLETEKHGDKTEYFIKHKNNLINFIPSVKLVDCMLQPIEFGSYSKGKNSSKKVKLDRDDILNFTVSFKTPEEDPTTLDNEKKIYTDNRKIIAKNKGRRLRNYGKRERSVTTKVRQQTPRTRINSKKKSFTLSSDRVSQTEISITISAEGRIFKDLSPMRKVDSKKTFTSLPRRKGKFLSGLSYQPCSKENILSDRMLRVRKGRLSENKVGCQESSITSSGEDIISVFPVSLDIPITLKVEQQSSQEVSSTEKTDEPEHDSQLISEPLPSSSSKKEDENEQLSVVPHEPLSQENFSNYPNVSRNIQIDDPPKNNSDSKQTYIISHEREEVRYELPCPAVENSNLLSKENRISLDALHHQLRLHSDQNNLANGSESLNVQNIEAHESFTSPYIKENEEEAPSNIPHQQQCGEVISAECNRRLRERKPRASVIKEENHKLSTTFPVKVDDEPKSDLANLRHSEKNASTIGNKSLRSHEGRKSIKNEKNQDSTLGQRKSKQPMKKEDNQEYAASSGMKVKESTTGMSSMSHSEENASTDGSESLNVPKGKQPTKKKDTQDSKLSTYVKANKEKTPPDETHPLQYGEIISVDENKRLRERKRRLPKRDKESATLPKRKDRIKTTPIMLNFSHSEQNDPADKKDNLQAQKGEDQKYSTSSISENKEEVYQQQEVKRNRKLKERKAKLPIKKKDKQELATTSSEKKDCGTTQEFPKLPHSKENSPTDENEMLQKCKQSRNVENNQKSTHATHVNDNENVSTDAINLQQCEEVFLQERRLRERKPRPLIMNEDKLGPSTSDKKIKEPMLNFSDIPYSKKINSIDGSEGFSSQKSRHIMNKEDEESSTTTMYVKANADEASLDEPYHQPCEEIISVAGNRRLRERKARPSIKKEYNPIKKLERTPSEKKSRELTNDVPNLPESEDNSPTHRNECLKTQSCKQSKEEEENQESIPIVCTKEKEENASRDETNHQQGEEIISLERSGRLRERKSKPQLKIEDNQKHHSSSKEKGYESLTEEPCIPHMSSMSDSEENASTDGSESLNVPKGKQPTKKKDTQDSKLSTYVKANIEKTPPDETHPLQYGEIISVDENKSLRERKCRLPKRDKESATLPKRKDRIKTTPIMLNFSHSEQNDPADKKDNLQAQKGEDLSSPTLPSEENVPTDGSERLRISKTRQSIKIHMEHSTTLSKVKDEAKTVEPNYAQSGQNNPVDGGKRTQQQKINDQECSTLSYARENAENISSGITHYFQGEEIISGERNRRLRVRKGKQSLKKENSQEHPDASFKEKLKEPTPEIPNIPHSEENVTTDESERFRVQKEMKPINKEENQEIIHTSFVRENTSSDVTCNQQCEEIISVKVSRRLRERKVRPQLQKKDMQQVHPTALFEKKEKALITDNPNLPYTEDNTTDRSETLWATKVSQSISKVEEQGSSPAPTLSVTHHLSSKEINYMDGNKRLRYRKCTQSNQNGGKEDSSISYEKKEKEPIPDSPKLLQSEKNVSSFSGSEKCRVKHSIQSRKERRKQGFSFIASLNNKEKPSSEGMHQQLYEEISSPGSNKISIEEEYKQESSFVRDIKDKVSSDMSHQLLSAENIHSLRNRKLGERKGEEKESKEPSISLFEAEKKEVSSDLFHKDRYVEKIPSDGKRILRERKGKSLKKVGNKELPATSLMKEDNTNVSLDIHYQSHGNGKLREGKVTCSIEKDDNECLVSSLETEDQVLPGIINSSRFIKNISTVRSRRTRERKRKSPINNDDGNAYFSSSLNRVNEEEVSSVISHHALPTEDIPSDGNKKPSISTLEGTDIPVSSDISDQPIFSEDISVVENRRLRSRKARSPLNYANNQEPFPKKDCKEKASLNVTSQLPSAEKIPVDDSRLTEEIEIGRPSTKSMENQKPFPISQVKGKKKEFSSDTAKQSDYAEEGPSDKKSRLRERKMISSTNLNDQEPSIISLTREDKVEIPLDGKRRFREKKNCQPIKEVDEACSVSSLEIENKESSLDLPHQSYHAENVASNKNKSLRVRNDRLPLIEGEQGHLSTSSVVEDKMKDSSCEMYQSSDHGDKTFRMNDDRPSVNTLDDQTSSSVLLGENKFEVSSSMPNQVTSLKNISEDKNKMSKERHYKPPINQKDEHQPSTSFSAKEANIEVSSDLSLQPHSVRNVSVANSRLRKRKGKPSINVLNKQESSITSTEISSILSHQCRLSDIVPVIGNEGYTEKKYILTSKNACNMDNSIIVPERIDEEKSLSDNPSQSISNSSIPDCEGARLMTLEGLPPIKKIRSMDHSTTSSEGDKYDSSDLPNPQYIEKNIWNNEVERLRDNNYFQSGKFFSSSVVSRCEGKKVVSSGKTNQSISKNNIQSNGNNRLGIQEGTLPKQKTDCQEPSLVSSDLKGEDGASDKSFHLHSQNCLPACEIGLRHNRQSSTTVDEQELPSTSYKRDDNEKNSEYIPEDIRLEAARRASLAINIVKKGRKKSVSQISHQFLSQRINDIFMTRESVSPTTEVCREPSTSKYEGYKDNASDIPQLLPRCVSTFENESFQFESRKSTKGMKRKKDSTKSSRKTDNTGSSIFQKHSCDRKQRRPLSPYERELAIERFTESTGHGDIPEIIDDPEITGARVPLMPNHNPPENNGVRQQNRQAQEQNRQAQGVNPPQGEVEEEVNLSREQFLRLRHSIFPEFEWYRGYQYAYNYNNPNWLLEYMENFGRWKQHTSSIFGSFSIHDTRSLRRPLRNQMRKLIKNMCQRYNITL